MLTRPNGHDVPLPDSVQRILVLRPGGMGDMLLLLPMLDATANNAILEAQACGVPIVSTDVRGVASYVDSSFADLLPVGDVQGLADAVLRFVESGDERERRRRSARDHAVEHLSWQRLAPRTLEVYKSVVQRAE